MSDNAQTIEREEMDALWARYCKHRDIDQRNEIVLQYAWLVKRIVLRFRGRSSNYIQLDDLINNGMIALIDAVEKFDPKLGNKFETFASIKIRGAAIDCMRAQDWVPRSQRNQAKELDGVFQELYTKLGREPTREELAKQMDVDVYYLDKILLHRHDSFLFSYEEAVHEKAMSASPLNLNSPEEHLPEHAALQNELKEHLVHAIDRLSDRERLVISLYYNEHLKLKEIAEVMSVTESRVSQIHSQALLKLKNTLSDYREV